MALSIGSPHHPLHPPPLSRPRGFGSRQFLSGDDPALKKPKARSRQASGTVVGTADETPPISKRASPPQIKCLYAMILSKY